MLINAPEPRQQVPNQNPNIPMEPNMPREPNMAREPSMPREPQTEVPRAPNQVPNRDMPQQ